MGLSTSQLAHAVEWAHACKNASQHEVRSMLKKVAVEWTDVHAEKFEVCIVCVDSFSWTY